MEQQKNGILVISLDFEMYWGMLDSLSISKAVPIMMNVHNVVPRLLALFNEYEIHATWATVGAIMAENKKEFFQFLTTEVPKTIKKRIEGLGLISDDEESACPEAILFAPYLVEMIKNTPYQEIGSHLYSHYYCGMDDSKVEDFSIELRNARAIAANKGIMLQSLVYPRNQFGDEYIKEATKEGFLIYRGKGEKKHKIRNPKWNRVLGFANNYIPVYGNNSYSIHEIAENDGFNIKSSRFFKSYKKEYRWIEWIKLLRYKGEIRYAAKHREVYHMYWHPHNFAVNSDVNFKQLKSLLKYYEKMSHKYGMVSLSMSETVDYYKCNNSPNNQ